MRKRIVFILFSLIFTITFAQTGTKTPKYLMHVVKFSETLTKIAKKYDVTVNEILDVNPSITAGVLKPEQIIRIPNKQGKKIPITTAKVDDDKLKVKSTTSNTLVAKNAKQHTVQTGQTMYAISKMYNVSIEDIQKWNQLSDYVLKIGDVIYVSDPKGTKITEVKNELVNKSTTTIQTNTPEIEKPKMVEKPNAAAVINKPTVIASTKTTEVEKIKQTTTIPPKEENLQDEVSNTSATEELAVNNETQKELAIKYKNATSAAKVTLVKGTGAPMTTSLGAMETVFFAMHKTLPIGTVIKIKNLVNNKIVYAKVIGKLPETDENKHVIVRYSLGVKNNLALQNGKCYLQIEYAE